MQTNKSLSLSFLCLCSVLPIAAPRVANAATLRVGPNGTYAKPCQAIAAASPGDVIEIDAAGSYDGDVCAWTKDGLTLRGVGGRVRIDAAGRNAASKGIWVIGGDTVVENIEFSGARVPDKNGSGIRLDPNTNLTVRNCYFHDNEMGILTSSGTGSEVLIEHSEFANNGYGDGYSHNMYIGNVRKFTLRHSYSHHAKVGHLVKSRAAENHILYNRLTNESGTASYELDLPNGGTSYVIGNIIEQGPNTQNTSLLAYRMEGGATGNPGTDLYVINNTFVNNRSAGGIFVRVSTPTPVVIRNNIFYGTGTLTNQSAPALANNFQGDPLFVNRSAYDFRLTSGSPAANYGANPGSANGVSLTPAYQYVHPACRETRTSAGAIDAGAYELDGGGGNPVCGGSGTAPQQPAAALSSVTVSPSSLTGGASSNSNTVTLSAAAPSGGAVVTLSSSNSAATVPASVIVPAGATSAGFTISTNTVAASTAVTISASYDGVTRTASLTVNPQQSQTATLASLSLSPTSTVGGATTTANQIVLSGPAPSGGAVVSLSSSNTAAAQVPANVTVAAGATTATFRIATSPVSSATAVTIRASYGGVARTATLTVNPQSGGGQSLQLLTLTQTRVRGGTTVSGNRVTLSGPAPAGGIAVQLGSSRPSAAAPVVSTITIPAGASSATFDIRTGRVFWPTSVTISAAAAGVTKTAALTVTWY